MHPVHGGVGTEVPGNIPLWCWASVLVLRGAKCCRGRRMPVGHAVIEVGSQWRPASAPLRCCGCRDRGERQGWSVDCFIASAAIPGCSACFVAVLCPASPRLVDRGRGSEGAAALAGVTA